MAQKLMPICFNGTLLAKMPSLGENDRAFQYGDGLFETMRFEDGQVVFLEDHWQRLKNGLSTLQIQLPKGLSKERIRLQATELLEASHLSEKQTYRLKLMVWRKAGGFYTPTLQESNYLMTISNHESSVKLLKAGIASSTRVYLTTTSKFKTISALPYVLAGIEKRQKELDEIILLGENSYLAECLASNLFWFKEGTLFTPSLETGCIGGIMRKNILRQCKQKGIPAKKVKAKAKEIFTAEFVFCTNAMGVADVVQINEHIFAHELRQQLGLGAF